MVPRLARATSGPASPFTGRSGKVRQTRPTKSVGDMPPRISAARSMPAASETSVWMSVKLTPTRAPISESTCLR